MSRWALSHIKALVLWNQWNDGSNFGRNTPWCFPLTKSSSPLSTAALPTANNSNSQFTLAIKWKIILHSDQWRQIMKAGSCTEKVIWLTEFCDAELKESTPSDLWSCSGFSPWSDSLLCPESRSKMRTSMICHTVETIGGSMNPYLILLNGMKECMTKDSNLTLLSWRKLPVNMMWATPAARACSMAIDPILLVTIRSTALARCCGAFIAASLCPGCTNCQYLFPPLNC